MLSLRYTNVVLSVQSILHTFSINWFFCRSKRLFAAGRRRRLHHMWHVWQYRYSLYHVRWLIYFVLLSSLFCHTYRFYVQTFIKIITLHFFNPKINPESEFANRFCFICHVSLCQFSCSIFPKYNIYCNYHSMHSVYFICQRLFKSCHL